MAKENIFKAMGSLAYAIALADGKIQDSEKAVIKKLALEEFELTEVNSVLINNVFKELEDKKISKEDAYQYALDTLEANRFAYDFDEIMKKKCLKFIERTADAVEGTNYHELNMIHKIKYDLASF